MFDDEDGLWAGKPKEDPARHPELYDWMTLEPTAAWENYVRPPTVEYDLKNRMTENGSISECCRGCRGLVGAGVRIRLESSLYA